MLTGISSLLKGPGDHDRRIYHYHIQKTGGTSINLAFCELAYDPAKFDLDEAGGNPPDPAERSPGGAVYHKINQTPLHVVSGNGYTIAGWNHWIINLGRYFYAFSHKPAQVIRIPPNTYTFTIFRDPIRRVLSRFKHILRLKEMGIEHLIADGKEKYAALTEDSIDAFLDLIDKSLLMHQLYMFSTEYSVQQALENVASRCTRVFSTGSFEKAVNHLQTDLGLPLSVGHAKKSTRKLSLNDVQQERLRELLQPEYELLAQVKTLDNFSG